MGVRGLHIRVSAINVTGCVLAVLADKSVSPGGTTQAMVSAEAHHRRRSTSMQAQTTTDRDA